MFERVSQISVSGGRINVGQNTIERVLVVILFTCSWVRCKCSIMNFNHLRTNTETPLHSHQKHWSTCMYSGRHACILVDMHVHWSTCMYIGRHACILVDMHVHWSTCMYSGRHACTVVDMHVHWSTCMYSGWHACTLVDTVVDMHINVIRTL